MGIFGYVLGLLLLGENMVRSAHALFPDGLGRIWHQRSCYRPWPSSS